MNKWRHYDIESLARYFNITSTSQAFNEGHVTEKVEEKMWSFDGIIDEAVKQVECNVKESSNSDSSHTSDTSDDDF